MALSPAAVTFVIPTAVLLYAVMSGLTFALYWVDKGRAVKGKWRLTESMLHACELLGGWPGALVGQQVLRHKNRKAGYQVVFWGIVLLHLAFWAWRWGWVRV